MSGRDGHLDHSYAKDLGHELENCGSDPPHECDDEARYRGGGYENQVHVYSHKAI